MCSRRLGLPEFLDSRYMKVVNLSTSHSRLYPYVTSQALICVRVRIDPRAGKNKSINIPSNPKGNRTREFSACNAVLQPNTPQCASFKLCIWGLSNDNRDKYELHYLLHQTPKCKLMIGNIHTNVSAHQHRTTPSSDKKACEMQSCVRKSCWSGTREKYCKVSWFI